MRTDILKDIKLAFPIYRTEEQIKRIEEMESEEDMGDAGELDSHFEHLEPTKKSLIDYIKGYATGLIALSALIGVFIGGYQVWDSQKVLAQDVKNNSKSISVIKAESNLSSLTANYYELLTFSKKFHVDERLKKRMDHAYRAMIAAEEQLRELKGK